ncbi:required for drug-induced death protein 1 [Lepisosteus oculatus]|uniref:Uncharacterized protein n=1 Tax=Lepisosteus oculatus TaxID=7918 RepID=W5NL07_LEPOC|nr:PREDICTED: uncharacterized protein C1orf115 homolog [Lepisosteus oculatus]XP_015213261.1 PREDICTED: uncharacterized protein C1orf115 homolog [Lepisosteus oculatus]XP_015213266.1 PREDICTED: uncharacterized protein C1orf115 homolog [Lepisosteus oculatus]
MKQKTLRDDRAKIVENIEEQFVESPNTRKVKKWRKRQSDSPQAAASEGSGGSSTSQGDKRSSRQVHFAFLPDKYEPLVEDDETTGRAKEEKKQQKKQKYKKYRKNVGKALRFGWRCLVIGLQEFAAGYSSPMTVATALFPDTHGARSRS